MRISTRLSREKTNFWSNFHCETNIGKMLRTEFTGCPRRKWQYSGRSQYRSFYGGGEPVHVNVSYSERFSRYTCFTEQKFGFGAHYCPSLQPYCALLDFCLLGWMKSKVYRTKVDTRDELLELIMDAVASIKGTSRCTQTSNTQCTYTSCKVHWRWRWDFRKCIALGELYQPFHLNNKYRY